MRDVAHMGRARGANGWVRVALVASLCGGLPGGLGAAHGVARAQECVDSDGSGDMCLNLIRNARVDGVVDDIFQTSDGRYAPQLNFGTLVRGVNGCIGQTHTPTILSGYTCGAVGTNPPGGDDPSFHANSLDWYWTQVLRTHPDGRVVTATETTGYEPTRGRVYDLGGEANRVVLFPITDHAPLPCEAFEYTVWLSNDPNALETASPDAPDPRMWNPALLIRVFTKGWTENPTATGADEAARPDLGTHLRTPPNPMEPAVADALATVWALPCGLSFRYASIQAGNNGNPGPECVFHSTDDELDAVAGLNEDDTAICIDADGDGHRAASCGGGDCDDTDPSIHPGAFEPCESEVDLDCQPARTCPEGSSCDADSGLCVSVCFEGGCAEGFSCVGDHCVETACANLEEPCPSGTLCREGVCVAPCDGVVCPDRQVCAGGACIDPCAGVVCPSNQVCIARDPNALTVCGPACSCDEIAVSLCDPGTECDARDGSATSGECVSSGCEVAECGPGEVCRAGGCVDGCAGVQCPLDQVCVRGECQTDRCAAVVCPGGQVCRDGSCFDSCDGVSCGAGMLCAGGACVPDPCFGVECGAEGRCVEGTCVPTGTPRRDGGGGGMDASAGERDAGSTTPGGVVDGGCGCRVEAGGLPSAPVAGLFVLGLAVVSRRRRR